jgi:uncharacterized protein (DUF302 family)
VADPGYGFGRTVAAGHAEVVSRVREALKQEGFGVITEIDVAATMKEKLDRDVAPYVILGACNPGYAHQVLEADRELGLFLPCNVIVYETADGTRVSAVDPEAMLGLSGNQDLAGIAVEVKARLQRAIERF